MACSASRGVLDEVVKLLVGYQGPVLSDLLETDLVRLAMLCKVTSCEPGDVVVNTWDKPDVMHIALDGAFQVVATSSGDLAEVTRIERGDPFGDFVMVTGMKRASALLCANRGRIVCVPKKSLDEILDRRSSAFYRQLYETVNSRISRLAPTKTDLLNVEDQGLATPKSTGIQQRAESWTSPVIFSIPALLLDYLFVHDLLRSMI